MSIINVLKKALAVLMILVALDLLITGILTQVFSIELSSFWLNIPYLAYIAIAFLYTTWSIQRKKQKHKSL